MERDTLPPPRTPLSPSVWVTSGLLVVSVVLNVALMLREPRTIERHIAVVPPPVPGNVPDASCPPPPECPTCPQCPEIVVPTHAAPGGPPGHLPVDRTAAAQAEGHLNAAETTGERDPVQVAAQRHVADGVDRIVASHSPASAERFLTRNLPALASMD